MEESHDLYCYSKMSKLCDERKNQVLLGKISISTEVSSFFEQEIFFVEMNTPIHGYIEGTPIFPPKPNLAPRPLKRLILHLYGINGSDILNIPNFKLILPPSL